MMSFLFSECKVYYHEFFINFQSKTMLTKINRELKILKENSQYCNNSLMFCLALALNKTDIYSSSLDGFFSEIYSFSHHSVLSRRLKLVLKSKERYLNAERLNPLLILFEDFINLKEIVIKTEILDSCVLTSERVVKQ